MGIMGSMAERLGPQGVGEKALPFAREIGAILLHECESGLGGAEGDGQRMDRS